MKILFAAVLLLSPLVAFAADAKPAARKSDKPALRENLLVAYAQAYSINELLPELKSAYSVACLRPESFSVLEALDMIMQPSIKTKKNIGGLLANAAALAEKDKDANHFATLAANELAVMVKNVEILSAEAQSCADWIKKQQDPATGLSWGPARTHATLNAARAKEFDASADLAAAKAIVEKTK